MKKFLLLFLFLFFAGICFTEEFFVCIGSFKNPKNADAIVKKLKEEGKESFVFETQRESETFFRVLLSEGFEKKENARAFRDSVQDSAIAKKLNLSGLWICAATKESFVPPVSELPKNAALLEENKNEIPVSEENPFSVLIHSYKEEQAAEYGKERLKENDIDSFILKTFDDKTYFSFDLHSGAFNSEDEAKNLQEKLESLGIENTKISEYSDEKEKIRKYDELIKTQNISYDFGKTEIPSLFSPHIATIIREFPINKNFSIERLLIVDFDNLRNKEKNSSFLDDFDNFEDFVQSPENIHAASIAFYKDELFNKSVSVVVFSGEENCFPDISEINEKIQEEEDGVKMREEKFQSKKEVLNSAVFYDDENYFFYGTNEMKNLSIFMVAEDFSEKEFELFINNLENDSSLLIYPQVRRTLLVLPKESEVHHDFLTFTLEKVNESYAESKGYADWSLPIVGHWNADARLCQNEEEICVSFFDLDYDYNARQIHEMFMDSHIVNDFSHASTVKNAPSWFVKTLDGNEVSFSTKSYIVAVGSPVLEEETLSKLSDELQIWE